LAGRRLETMGLLEVFAGLAERTLPSEVLLAELLAMLSQAAVRDDVTLVALRRLGP